jgi:hypothetical protein
MSRRDYEELPEAPDLGEAVQEDTGETLVGPPDSDPLDAGYVPPDRPYLVEDDQALSGSEDLDSRLARERPDVQPDDPASVRDQDPERAPRFSAAEPTPGTDHSESLTATDDGIAGGAASAEEAAVQLHGDNE